MKKQEKWEKKDGCDCYKCREVEIKDHDYCPDKKWDKRESCDCKKCREITIKVECNNDHNKKDHDKKDHDKKEQEKKKHDRNDWIREKLEGFIDSRVVIFTKGGTHTEGTVRDVRKDFVVLVPTINTTFEAVEVESNDQGDTLENFLKYFIRLDDIVGFGQETLGD
jgi:hypothetical protein